MEGGAHPRYPPRSSVFSPLSMERVPPALLALIDGCDFDDDDGCGEVIIAGGPDWRRTGSTEPAVSPVSGRRLCAASPGAPPLPTASHAWESGSELGDDDMRSDPSDGGVWAAAHSRVTMLTMTVGELRVAADALSTAHTADAAALRARLLGCLHRRSPGTLLPNETNERRLAGAAGGAVDASEGAPLRRGWPLYPAAAFYSRLESGEGSDCPAGGATEPPRPLWPTSSG